MVLKGRRLRKRARYETKNISKTMCLPEKHSGSICIGSDQLSVRNDIPDCMHSEKENKEILACRLSYLFIRLMASFLCAQFWMLVDGKERTEMFAKLYTKKLGILEIEGLKSL